VNRCSLPDSLFAYGQGIRVWVGNFGPMAGFTVKRGLNQFADVRMGFVEVFSL